MVEREPPASKKQPVVTMPKAKPPPKELSNYDHMFKVIIIGNPTAGKTSLLMRAAEGKRNESYEVTVGVDCKSRTFDY